jgi:hypothetical protein
MLAYFEPASRHFSGGRFPHKIKFARKGWRKNVQASEKHRDLGFGFAVVFCGSACERAVGQRWID